MLWTEFWIKKIICSIFCIKSISLKVVSSSAVLCLADTWGFFKKAFYRYKTLPKVSKNSFCCGCKKKSYCFCFQGILYFYIFTLKLLLQNTEKTYTEYEYLQVSGTV